MYPRPPTWSSPSGRITSRKLRVLQVCPTSFECTMRLPVNPFFFLMLPIQALSWAESFRTSLSNPSFLRSPHRRRSQGSESTSFPLGSKTSRFSLVGSRRSGKTARHVPDPMFFDDWYLIACTRLLA